MFVSGKHILTQPVSTRLQSAVMRAQIPSQGSSSEMCRMLYDAYTEVQEHSASSGNNFEVLTFRIFGTSDNFSCSTKTTGSYWRETHVGCSKLYFSTCFLLFSLFCIFKSNIIQTFKMKGSTKNRLKNFVLHSFCILLLLLNFDLYRSGKYKLVIKLEVCFSHKNV